MIPLNSYTKRVTAKILNLASNLTIRYSPDQVIGIRHIDGIAQVRVKVGESAYVLPFDAVQFKAMVEACRLKVIAAICAEEAWERRRAVVVANHEGTRLYSPSTVATRQITVRIGFKLVDIQIGFNTIRLERDAASSPMLYYAYGDDIFF
jgi:hypothetical protein